MPILLYYLQFQNTFYWVTLFVNSFTCGNLPVEDRSTKVLIHPSKMSYLCVKVVHHNRTKSCPIAEWSVIRMPFEYRTKFCPVFGPPFEYRTGIQMVVWIPNYHLNTGHLNTGQVKVRYSDVSVIQMFVIQIPTVFKLQWGLEYQTFSGFGPNHWKS